MAKFYNTTAGQVLILGGAISAAAYVSYRAIAAAGGAIAPTNPDNIFHTGANQIGANLTGDDGFNLGFWIYEKIHGKGGG